MASTAQLFQAVELLKRGVTRLFVMRCPSCRKRNRIDRWRLFFGRATKANCGNCGVRLMWR